MAQLSVMFYFPFIGAPGAKRSSLQSNVLLFIRSYYCFYWQNML